MLKRKQARGGIERKFLTSILWVGVTPLILALIGYFLARQAQRIAIIQTLSTTARQTAEGVGLAMDSRLRLTAQTSLSPYLLSALTAEPGKRALALGQARRFLGHQARYSGDIGAVYNLYDRDGAFLGSSLSGTVDLPGHPEWAKTPPGLRFTDFDYFADEQRYAASIVAPVTDPGTGEILGFLEERQGLEDILRFALGEGPSRGHVNSREIVYVGEDREFVVHAGPAGGDRFQPVYAAPDPRLIARIRKYPERDFDEFAMGRYSTHGTVLSALMAYHRLMPGSDLYVLVYRPTSDVYAKVDLGALVIIALSALIIGSFCVIAYRFVNNNIIRPVSLLNEGAQIIRQGDLELKLKIDTGDEIEGLANSFNRMATALRQNISRLEESEEKYRSVINSMRDGIYQTDPSGRIALLNPAGARILGFPSPADAHGVSLHDLFVEGPEYRRFMRDLEEHRFAERVRAWVKTRRGRSICVELTANRVFDDEGGFMGMEGTFRDVTRSLRLEHEARERSERIEVINQIANAINSSLEAGRVYESIAVEVRKLITFDYASVALAAEGTSGFLTHQLWPDRGAAPSSGPNHCAEWVAREEKALLVTDLHKNGSSFAGQFPGDIRSCLCAPLYAADKIIGTLNVGSRMPGGFTRHDAEVLEQLTPHVAVAIRNARLLENLQASLEEVTQAREKLHAAIEELKTLDEMKTNLLSNVSHELRTPLVAVMGYTDMILNGKAGVINDVQEEFLQISLRNIEKLVTLIENLLDFSRLHRGAEELVFDTYDISDCARMSLQIVQPVADSRNIRLDLVAPEDPVYVEGDKGKVGQVFNNLLSNAVKFNQPGGFVRIDIDVGEEDVEVRVTDNGIGIPAEAQDKIFTRFYQYDGSSTRKYGGTGIGLAISQDIMRLHGSRITVQSREQTPEEPGETTFRFTLPLSMARKRSRGDAGALLPLPTETHLLIEVITQDRALSAQIRSLLISEGMDVIHAAYPSVAVDLAQRYSPDCILLDTEAGPLGHVLVEDMLRTASGFSAEGGLTPVQAPIVLLTSDDALFERYRPYVSGRVKRSFRKSTLLSGIHYALSKGVPAGEQLGSKVLCVDDDEEIVRFIARCLNTEGYETVTCSSGEEALEEVARGAYWLVLLDIAMPGLDGFETCRRIKKDVSLAGIRVYLVTAKTIEKNLAKVKECSADGYLLKPFKPEDLISLLQGIRPGHPGGAEEDSPR